MPLPDWIRGQADVESGSLRCEAQYCRGSGTSRRWLPELAPILLGIFGAEPHPGSFNLWATAPVCLPNPARVSSGERAWLFVPVLVDLAAIGVAARVESPSTSAFIEVFAPWNIERMLNVKPGARLQIRLLEGRHLAIAA